MSDSQEEKVAKTTRERQRDFRRTRTLIAIRNNLIPGLRQAAFMDGRSMANLANMLIWRHLEANGLTVQDGITDWSWRKRQASDVRDEIDKVLGEGEAG